MHNESRKPMNSPKILIRQQETSMKTIRILSAVLLVCFVTPACPLPTIVSGPPSGQSDDGPGTADKPWKRIAKAAATVQAGDAVRARRHVREVCHDQRRRHRGQAHRVQSLRRRRSDSGHCWWRRQNV